MARRQRRHSRLASVGAGMPTVVAPAAASARADAKYPAEIAVDYLVKGQPLITPEWSAWKAVMHTPKLEGKWLLTGYQQGKGRVFGTVTIEPGSDPDEFVTKTELDLSPQAETLCRARARESCTPVTAGAGAAPAETAVPERGSWLSSQRMARGFVCITRCKHDGRPLVLGRLSGIRDRRSSHPD